MTTLTHVKITGNGYSGTATSASGGGSSLTAFAVSPAMPSDLKGKSFTISGEEHGSTQSFTGNAQSILPAEVTFDHVKPA